MYTHDDTPHASVNFAGDAVALSRESTAMVGSGYGKDPLRPASLSFTVTSPGLSAQGDNNTDNVRAWWMTTHEENRQEDNRRSICDCKTFPWPFWHQDGRVERH
jgi:hypothetical protein